MSCNYKQKKTKTKKEKKIDSSFQPIIFCILSTNMNQTKNNDLHTIMSKKKKRHIHSKMKI